MASSLQKKPLELSDRALLEPLLTSCHLMLSEYSFANLYLFRKEHQYELVLDDFPYIQGRRYDNSPFIMPTSEDCLEFLKAKRLQLPLFPIPQEWLEGFDPNSWDKSFLDAESDYIYETKTLAHYPGRHLSKKKKPRKAV